MNASDSLVYFKVPYVLVCGSYQNNRANDRLCSFLGNALANQNVGLISGGGNPAIKVAEGMNKTLTDMGFYDPFKIITVYRKKSKNEDLKIKRIGCSLFVGKDVHEMREYLFSKPRVLIAVGGATKTKEEILMT